MPRPVLASGAVAVVMAAAGLFWILRTDERGSAPPDAPSAAPAPAAEAAPAPRAAPVEAVTFDPRAATLEAEAGPAAPAPEGVVVTGKIVDGRRHAVAGAEVEFRAEDRNSVRGTSDAGGRFRIPAGPRPARATRAFIRAKHGDGRTAWAAPAFGPDAPETLDAGVLALAGGHAARLRVTENGTPVASARVFVARAGWLQHFAFFETGPDGIAAGFALPPGDWAAAAFSPSGSRGDARFELPAAGDGLVEVSLAPAWDLRVRVLEGSEGPPLAGYRLDATFNVRGERGISVYEPVLPAPVLPTGDDGTSVIRSLPREHPIRVEAHPPGAAGRGTIRRARQEHLAQGTAKPGDPELVLAVAAGRTFTFPLGSGEVPSPPEGASLRLSVPAGFGGAPPPPSGTIRGNAVVVERASERCVNLLATAPDGSLALLRLLGDAKKTGVGSEAAFKKPRTLVIAAKDRAGRPLAGWIASLHTPGNSEIGDGATLDADGAARIVGLFPQPVNVRLRRPGSEAWPGILVGHADLADEEVTRLDAILESERAALLRVRIDGAPALPATYTLRLTGAEAGPVEEDAERAELRFPFRPETGVRKITLHLTAAGHPSATCELALPPEPAPVDASVDLVTGAAVQVRILPPSDGLHQTSLQTWSEKEQAWRPVLGQQGRVPGLEDDRRTDLAFDALPAGRYRARDGMSGAVTEPVDVAAGASRRIVLDLSRSGIVTGKVAAPVGTEIGLARVRVEGEGVHRPGDETGVEDGIRIRGQDGSFQVRVPGDRPVTLRAWHPLLSASAEQGQTVVTGPREGVVLALVPGPLCVLRLPQSPPESGFMSRHRVLLFSDVSGEAPREHPLLFKDGVGRFGGFAPGRWRLWCDLPPHAPLDLGALELGAGTTDLGTLQPGPGASIRLTVLSRPGQEPPRIDVSARHLGQPFYWRSRSRREGAEIVVPGLGPGRFSVSIVKAAEFGRGADEREVVSDGATAIPLTLDLR